MHYTSRSWPRLAILLSVVVLFASCASREGKLPAGTAQPDKFLFDRGTENLNKKKWLKAREYFRQLVDNYPQSQYRPDAKLGLGDTYLGENTAESVVLAVNEYREFLTFYPTSRRADYAQFKLGMAHYAQMLAPQRDQTQTREAIKEFDVFVQHYPTSSLLPEGKKKLRECHDRLDDSEYAVGVFYWRSRWYPGAIDRLKGIVKNDPDYTNRDAVYYYLADSYAKVKMQAEAMPYLDKLLKEFQKSEYLERAKKLMAELKSQPAPDKAKPEAADVKKQESAEKKD